MTLPEKLRKWADKRDTLMLDSRLLRDAASEIEKLRKYVKELERDPDPHGNWNRT